MPTKRNSAGEQQPYVPAGHGDASGEYGEHATGSNVHYASPDDIKRQLGYKEEETKDEINNTENENLLNQTDKQVIDKNFEKEKKKFDNLETISRLFSEKEEDFNEKIVEENKWLGSVGTQPEILKKGLKELGYLEKPTVIDSATFDKYKRNGAHVIYRGVAGQSNAEQALRDNEDVYIGRGAESHGLFFSDDLTEAQQYQKDGSLIEAILHPNAKVINIKELKEIENDLRMDAITGKLENDFLGKDKNKVEKFFEGRTGRTRRPLIAALMGYDAIDMDHNVTVILNRNSLIMRGDK